MKTMLQYLTEYTKTFRKPKKI